MIDENFLRIGVIAGPHGLTGRLKILIITDIRERFKINKPVYLEINKSHQKFIIEDFAVHKGRIGLLQLSGIGDRNSAEAIKGSGIFIEQSEAEGTRDGLDADSFYYYDIIGCAAYFRGTRLGTVTDILEAGAGEILIIKNENGREFMLPFVESMVDTSNIRDRRLDIEPVEGLFEI